jgi:hypothetical protein
MNFVSIISILVIRVCFVFIPAGMLRADFVLRFLSIYFGRAIVFLIWPKGPGFKIEGKS